MSAPLTSRDALAEVVLNNGIRSVRDASAYTSGVDEAYCREVAEDIADALLASGALIDAMKLAAEVDLIIRGLELERATRPASWRTTEWADALVGRVIDGLAALLGTERP